MAQTIRGEFLKGEQKSFDVFLIGLTSGPAAQDLLVEIPAE